MFYNIVFKHVYANVPYCFVSGCIWALPGLQGLCLVCSLCWFVWLLFMWYSYLYDGVFCMFLYSNISINNISKYISYSFVNQNIIRIFVIQKRKQKKYISHGGASYILSSWYMILTN